MLFAGLGIAFHVAGKHMTIEWLAFAPHFSPRLSQAAVSGVRVYVHTSTESS